MKHTKITAAFLSAMMLALPVCAGGCPMISLAADPPRFDERLPEWVPMTYPAAVEFYNQHGGTYIDSETGLVCVLFGASAGANGDYEVNTTGDALLQVYRITAETKTEYGEPSAFEILLYQAVKPGKFEVCLENKSAVGTGIDYTFEADSDLNVTETDIFAWLPDCSLEFYRMFDRPFAVSHGDCILIGRESAAGEPVKSTVNLVTEVPTHSLFVDCTELHAEPVDGGCKLEVEAVWGEADGPATVTRKQTGIVLDQATVPETAYFRFLDKGKVVLGAGDVRFTVVDADTGELIPTDGGCNMAVSTDVAYYEESLGDYVYTGPIFVIDPNPCIQHNFGGFFHADQFSFTLSGSMIAPVNRHEADITEYDHAMYDIVFRTKMTADGDFNNDARFSIGDAVELQKWLTGQETSEYIRWRAADFNLDGRLDVRDMTLMKQKLIAELAEKTQCTMTVKREHLNKNGELIEEDTTEQVMTVFEDTRIFEKITGKLTADDGDAYSDDWRLRIHTYMDGDEAFGICENGVSVMARQGDVNYLVTVPYDEPQKSLFTTGFTALGDTYVYTVTFSDPKNIPS